MTLLRRQHIFGPLLAGVLFLLLGTLLRPSLTAVAQPSDPLWNNPVNLSQSGAADRPSIVVDASGQVHIIWQDSFAGYIYRNGDGHSFNEPRPVEFPFGRLEVLPNGNTIRPLYSPILRAGPAGAIHAVWTDNDDALFYSRVASSEFPNLSAWLPAQQLAESAAAHELAVDDGGELHLIYARPLSSELFPAGIYYRRSTDGGDGWSDPNLLFQSPYFRGLNSQQARVGLAVAESGQLVAAWDNRPQERVLAIHSGDGGQSWESPIEIDRRVDVDGEEAAGPRDVLVTAQGGTIHLFWQAGHEAVACGQYHQWSIDGGLTWLPRQRILAAFEGCPADLKVVRSGERLLLFAQMASGVYSTVWHDGQWSEPQRQGVLATFVNPDTYRPVNFGCRQAAQVTGQLIFVGCDESQTSDEVWLVTGSAEAVGQAGLADDLVWASLQMIAQRGDSERLADPTLVSDGDGFLHAFWSQGIDQGGSAINYARWDGAGWSPPVDVLTSPNGQYSERPAAALAGSDRLLTAWDSGPDGELYFSQTAVSTAGTPAEWFAPQAISAPGVIAVAPDILIGQDRTIYVIYAVRLNEDRGIFIVRSEDEGESWSDPFPVFDAVQAGWESVDQPRLAMTGDGVLHAVWLERSLPPENAPLGMFYAASTDRGENWSAADPVPFDERPAAWGDVLGANLETVHLLWREDVDLESSLWSQISPDGGLSWETPRRVSDVGNLAGPSSVTINAAGEPQLVQLVSDEVNSRLQQWSWTSGGWMAGVSLVLQPGQPQGVSGVAAAVSSNGGLAVLFAGQVLNLETGRLIPGLLASARQVDLVIPTPTPRATDETVAEISGSPPEAAESNAEPATAAPTPTTVSLAGVDDNSSRSGGSLTTIVTIVVTLLVAGVLIVIGLRAFREH
jgi:hypothetical protein